MSRHFNAGIVFVLVVMAPLTLGNYALIDENAGRVNLMAGIRRELASWI